MVSECDRFDGVFRRVGVEQVADGTVDDEELVDRDAAMEACIAAGHAAFGRVVGERLGRWQVEGLVFRRSGSCWLLAGHRKACARGAGP